MNDTTEETTQRARIARLFSSMPYLGGTGIRYPNRDDEWTLDLIEHNLTLLRDRLEQTAERAQANESRLMNIDRLHRAVGELAGVIMDATRPRT